MSPPAGEVLAFALKVGAVLAAAALVIAAMAPWLRRRRPELWRELWLRHVSWVVIAVLVVGAVWWGRTAWIALVGILALAAFREYARNVGLWLDRWFEAVADVAIVLMFVWAWFPYEDASPEPGWYGLFIVMPAYATLAVLAIPVIRGRYEHMIQKCSLTILGIVYFGWFLGHFAYLVNLPGGPGYVLFLGMLVAVNDVGAFLTGKAFGRHKLRPRLSPGKTVEGAVGALVLTVAAAWAMRAMVPAYDAWAVPLVALGVGVAGTAGDLALSVIKRDLGIKDWSTAIPGHGGVLDRTNSLIFAVPLFFHVTRFFYA